MQQQAAIYSQSLVVKGSGTNGTNRQSAQIPAETGIPSTRLTSLPAVPAFLLISSTLVLACLDNGYPGWTLAEARSVIMDAVFEGIEK